MLFYIHNQTPKPKPNATTRFLFILGIASIGTIPLLCLIAALMEPVYMTSALPILLIYLGLFILTATLHHNTERSHIVIEEDTILVVTYPFFKPREKRFQKQQIATMEEMISSSFRMRGPRLRFLSYLVFRDARGKYLFKVAAFPNTKAFFEGHLATANVIAP